MFKSFYHALSPLLLPCAITIGLAACGDAPPEVRDAAQQTRDAAEDLTERTGEFGEDVAEGAKDVTKQAASTTDDVAREASDAAHAASDWVSNLEGPILEQRREKCAQESGFWVEHVEVGACENGSATVTVNETRVEQACEGDGRGQQLSWQCVHTTMPLGGTYYFNDGPSTPDFLQRLGELVSDRTHFLRWNDLFWDAAVNHDYCYHHGQITYGYTQKDCDGQILDDLLAICRSDRGEEHTWFDAETCMQNAQGMFGALRQFGTDNFNAINTYVQYPKYEPLFEKLGVAREDEDDERRNRIESLTF